eukprot:TRINITY_DN3620_c0_g1_i3.p1 TRINITY_DN3620_c0_g1~~TRINITY_DN3620_c0_g1_i3.p1  ORF type:complete len:270 (+),score=67.43 TRINITY_DN3620_c0_g1_i3:102-812(+)
MSAANASAATARNRNQTPPPRVAAKAASTPPAKAGSPAKPAAAAPKPEEKELSFLAKYDKYVAAFLLGFSVAVAAVCFVYAPQLTAYWKTVQKPLEKWLVLNSDLMVLVAALPFFAPFILVGAVLVVRAAGDLKKRLLWWQMLLLVLLVGTALATLMMDQKNRDFVVSLPIKVNSTWAQYSKPVEHFLVKNTDKIVVGAAAITLVPIGLCVFVSCLYILWGCRVTITPEVDPKKSK